MSRRSRALRHPLSFTVAGWPVLGNAESTTAADTALTSWVSIGKLAGALLLVLAIFFFCAWLVRQFQNPGSRSTGMRVVSALSVGHRERILIVQIGERQLLLGVTPHAIHTLHVLEQTLPGEPSPAAGFAGHLGNAFKRQETL